MDNNFHKKIFTIVLWVGLIISIIAAIVLLIGDFKMANDFVENEDSYWTVDRDEE
jgi:uncharacterized membrane protein